MFRNKVSVIIPNYNHEKYLHKRIESVLDQTFRPVEIIILDDCSTDNSVSIIEEFIKLYPQIKFVKNEVNSGSTFAQWNKGVGLASGNLIWIAESDDTAAACFLEMLIPKFENNNDLVLAYCQSNKINKNDIVTDTWKSHTAEFGVDIFDHDFEMNGMEFIENFLIHKNCIPNASAVVFRKEIYNQTNGATPALKNHGDWLVWLKLLCKGNLAFIAEPLNNFRFHSNSVIAKSHASETTVYKDLYGFEMRKELNKFINSSDRIFSKKVLAFNSNYFALDTGHYGLFLLKNKKYFGAWKHILKATFSPKLQTIFLKKALGFRI